MSNNEAVKTSSWVRFKEFISVEVPSEMKKVSWPTKDGVYSSTKAVIISVLLVSFYIAVIDRVFSAAFQYFLK
ncbi:MAG: preprotein translocase subunit SecE [Candidatus Wallbacteria bacterium]